MALMTAINFLGVRKLAATNSAATWWKVAVPLLTILVLAIANFDTGNLHAANGFNPGGPQGILAAVSTGGIIFSYLGFEQADQLAGESSEPQARRPVRDHRLDRARHDHLHRAAGHASCSRCPRAPSAAPGPTRRSDGLLHRVHRTVRRARDRCSASAGWPRSSTLDAIISPAGTGLIYTTGSSRVAYGLSRNGYVPSMFEWTNDRGVPWVGLIAAFVTGCICFLPFPSWQSLVGLITSASVLMYAGAPLSLGRLPPAAPRRRAAVPAARGGDPVAARRSSSRT